MKAAKRGMGGSPGGDVFRHSDHASSDLQAYNICCCFGALMHSVHGCSTRYQGPWTAAHQLILLRLHGQAKHISIQRVTLLIHRWLAPAARLVPELGARRDGRIQTRDLRRLAQPLHLCKLTHCVS